MIPTEQMKKQAEQWCDLAMGSSGQLSGLPSLWWNHANEMGISSDLS